MLRKKPGYHRPSIVVFSVCSKPGAGKLVHFRSPYKWYKDVRWIISIICIIESIGVHLFMRSRTLEQIINLNEMSE